MDPNQIDGGERKGVAPPPAGEQTLSFQFSWGAEPGRLSHLVQFGGGGIRVGRRRFSASAASLLGRQDRFGDFFQPNAAGRWFPPRPGRFLPRVSSNEFTITLLTTRFP